jgi:hypothetical protein
MPIMRNAPSAEGMFVTVGLSAPWRRCCRGGQKGCKVPRVIEGDAANGGCRNTALRSTVGTVGSDNKTPRDARHSRHSDQEWTNRPARPTFSRFTPGGGAGCAHEYSLRSSRPY